ncbi:gliding motility lipoprotein GldH [Lacinutrix salivirga]
MRSNVVFLFILFLGVVSCDSKRVFDEYKSVSNAWNKNDKVSFTIPQPDSTNTYNLFVNLRTTNAYKYSNLFLIVSMEFPHGKTITDTLEYKMAEPNGQMLGEGISDVKEHKLWYKEGVDFNEDGAYKVHIQQAMRENGSVNGITNLEGVTDVGFRIEKTN